MSTTRKFLFSGAIALLFIGIGAAQPWGWGGGRRGRGDMIATEGGVWVDQTKVRTAREIASHSTGTPEWTNPPPFAHDVFTFVRIIRDRDPEASPSAGSWITDFPDSDLNLSFRLQQVTSLRVDANGRTLRLTDPDLFNYPWIYMVEPGGLSLREEEVPILRRYLLNGGVLWADDFWGEWQWRTFARQINRVLPGREFVEVDMTNQIFHCVFDIKVPKNKLQTPNAYQGMRSLDPNDRFFGITWEMNHPREGSWDRRDADPNECRNMHVRALYDDKGRIMIIATHNCDNGDGWEREGEDDGFFHEFSEKRAYPLAVNVLFYLMTH